MPDQQNGLEHLLRPEGGGYREATSQSDWTTYNGDVRGNRYSLLEQIKAGFAGYEAVRKPRYERAVDTSLDAQHLWADFWRADLEEKDLADFRKRAQERFEWLWNPDIAGQGERARKEMQRRLGATRSGEGQAKLA